MRHNKLKQRGRKITSVCPECRTVNRATFSGMACPKCCRTMLSIGTKYRVPPKGDDKGWKRMIRLLHLAKLPNAPLHGVLDEKADYDEMKAAAFKILSWAITPTLTPWMNRKLYLRMAEHRQKGIIGVPRGTRLTLSK